jgi:hypothetical protein
VVGTARAETRRFWVMDQLSEKGRMQDPAHLQVAPVGTGQAQLRSAADRTPSAIEVAALRMGSQ